MKRFVIVIGAIGVVCAIWFGGWLFVADRIEGEIAALAANDGVTEPRLDCESLEVRGFPYRFAPRCEGPVITVGDLDIELAMVQGTALFYRPSHIQIFADGPARLTDAFSGASQELRWDDVHASLRFTDGRIARFSAIAENLVYADMLVGEDILGTAGGAELHLIDASAPDAVETEGAVLDLFARIEDLTIPAEEISNGVAILDARLTGVPEMALWGHPDLLRIWQMADGGLEVRELDASAEGLSVSGAGAVMLTETGRLSGRASLSSTGLVERFGELADDPVAAMLIGQPDADGAYSQTVSLRNGVVTVGIIPVMTIDPLF